MGSGGVRSLFCDHDNVVRLPRPDDISSAPGESYIRGDFKQSTRRSLHDYASAVPVTTRNRPRLDCTSGESRATSSSITVTVSVSAS